MNADPRDRDPNQAHGSEGIGVEADVDAREFRIAVTRRGNVTVVPLDVEGAEALMRALEDFLSRVA